MYVYNLYDIGTFGFRTSTHTHTHTPAHAHMYQWYGIVYYEISV